MSLTDELNEILSRLDAEESPELSALTRILKQTMENTESAMIHHDRQIRLLEGRLKALESG